MNQYVLLFISSILFFILFYNLNEKDTEKDTEKVESFSPMTSNVTFEANVVDASYLNRKFDQLVTLKGELSEMRNTLYNKKLTDFIIINPKYKSIEDDTNPQQFDAEIKKDGNFSNSINLSVPIGKKGEQGSTGDRGIQGKSGDQGIKGPVGHCGAIIS